MEEAGGLGALGENDFLRVLPRFPPNEPAELGKLFTVRRRASPSNSITCHVGAEPALARRDPDENLRVRRRRTDEPCDPEMGPAPRSTSAPGGTLVDALLHHCSGRAASCVSSSPSTR